MTEGILDDAPISGIDTEIDVCPTSGTIERFTKATAKPPSGSISTVICSNEPEVDW